MHENLCFSLHMGILSEGSKVITKIVRAEEGEPGDEASSVRVGRKR